MGQDYAPDGPSQSRQWREKPDLSQFPSNQGGLKHPYRLATPVRE
jgi:hypothetical protein